MRIIGGRMRGTKLFTLEGNNTRPTLDRVKESLFNIINLRLQDATVLDLFGGSGALAIESISRGASKAYICDNSREAINVIKKNIEKTRTEEEIKIFDCNYEVCIEKITNKVDIIFLDPPYESDYYKVALNKINECNILNDDGLVVLETDDPERITKMIDDQIYNVTDKRKYGRVTLVFLNRKG